MDQVQSKLIRIESGAVTISTNDLGALLAHYPFGSAPWPDLPGAAPEAPAKHPQSISDNTLTYWPRVRGDQE